MTDPGETLIYIRERDVTPECWWPADATAVAPGTYKVSRVPPDRPLEFGVGDLVRCEMRAFPDGSEALLAIGVPR